MIFMRQNIQAIATDKTHKSYIIRAIQFDLKLIFSFFNLWTASAYFLKRPRFKFYAPFNMP